jgi:hypothetical protein
VCPKLLYLRQFSLLCSYEHYKDCGMSERQTLGSDHRTVSPARELFIRRIAELPIKPAARDYYVQLLALMKLLFVAEFLFCLSKAEASSGAATNLLSARGR